MREKTGEQILAEIEKEHPPGWGSSISPLWHDGRVKAIVNGLQKARQQDGQKRYNDVAAAAVKRFEEMNRRDFDTPTVRAILTDIAMLAVDTGSGEVHGARSSGATMTFDGAVIRRIMDLAGMKDTEVLPYGSCATCVFADGGRGRGWGAPCVGCRGATLDCHMTREQLAEALVGPLLPLNMTLAPPSRGGEVPAATA